MRHVHHVHGVALRLEPEDGVEALGVDAARPRAVRRARDAHQPVDRLVRGTGHVHAVLADEQGTVVERMHRRRPQDARRVEHEIDGETLGRLRHGDARRVRQQLFAPRRPRDAAVEVAQETLVAPHFGTVAERGVEDAAALLLARPRHGEVLVRAVDAGAPEVRRRRIELEQPVVARALVGRLELVDLVDDLERGAEMARRGMRPVLDEDRDVLVPRVAVEVAAEHQPVALVLVEGVAGAVRADERAAGLDPGEERVALRGRQRQLAGGVEEDALEAGQRGGLEARRVAARHRLVEARALAALHQRRLDQARPVGRRTVRHLVLVPGRDRVDEDARRRRRLLGGRGGRGEQGQRGGAGAEVESRHGDQDSGPGSRAAVRRADPSSGATTAALPSWTRGARLKPMTSTTPAPCASARPFRGDESTGGAA